MHLLKASISPLVWKDASKAPEICIVPEGVFQMGGIADDKFVTAVELPRHEVCIRQTFALGRTPVTRGEWLALMGCLPTGAGHDLPDDCPVTCATYPEVMAYLRELSITTGHLYRLPSESEWEYACRAGSESVFPQGPRLDSHEANFLYNELGDEIGSGRLSEVGLYPANAFGFADLLGNVCEWTEDLWHAGYRGAPDDGSAWIDGGKPACRVIRGGAWDHLPRVLRASWRDWAPEQSRWDNLGFRVARDL